MQAGSDLSEGLGATACDLDRLWFELYINWYMLGGLT